MPNQIRKGRVQSKQQECFGPQEGFRSEGCVLNHRAVYFDTISVMTPMPRHDSNYPKPDTRQELEQEQDLFIVKPQV